MVFLKSDIHDDEWNESDKFVCVCMRKLIW